MHPVAGVTPTSTAPAPAAGKPEQGGRTPRHLWDYWRIVWEGRRILVRTLAITLGVALLGTLALPKRYRAETLLEINFSQPAVLGSVIERAGGRNFFDEDRDFRTEFVKIKTRSMVQRAIERHDLKTAIPDLAEYKDEVAVEILRRAIEVDRVTQTNVAKLSVSWTNPAEAAVIANAIAQTYVVADLEAKTGELETRIGRLQSSLGQKSQARRRVIERELAIIATNPPLETILGLTTMTEKTTLQKLWEDLKEAERDLSTVQGGYGPASLEVREKVSARDRVLSQVNQSREAAISELKQELVALGGDPSKIQPKFDPVTVKEQEADAKFEEQLRDRVLEAQILAHTAEAKARIIEPAKPPGKPYSPRLMLNLLLAFVVGGGFGGGFILFRDYLDVSVKTLDDVEQDLGMNLLAVIPSHETGKPDDVVKEAYQTLRTGLLFSARGRQSRILLVTSGAPQEGKSTVVAQLARSMAAAGESVAVLDCDLRRGGVSRLFGTRGKAGLSTYLADIHAKDWRELLVKVEPNLFVMPTGPVPPNPVDLVGLERFVKLLGELRGAHDWVLLDSPPVSSVADAIVIAAAVDMVMVVMRHDQTDKEVIRRGLQRLRGVGANVVGAVLNDVDMSKSYNRDYYYGRFYYGSYYGEHADGSGGTGTGSNAPVTLEQRLAKLLKK